MNNYSISATKKWRILLLARLLLLYKCEKGTTLTELLLVIAIIGILALIAVPNFIEYRSKSRVASGVGTGEAVRAALASYAADSRNNLYPATGSIPDYNSLRLLVNTHGGSLPSTGVFVLSHYDSFDSNADGEADSYSMRVNVTGVPNTQPGFQLLITPQGIFKCTSNANPC
jgi:type IV pilus assembly protein PilA